MWKALLVGLVIAGVRWWPAAASETSEGMRPGPAPWRLVPLAGLSLDTAVEQAQRPSTARSDHEARPGASCLPFFEPILALPNWSVHLAWFDEGAVGVARDAVDISADGTLTWSHLGLPPRRLPLDALQQARFRAIDRFGCDARYCGNGNTLTVGLGTGAAAEDGAHINGPLRAELEGLFADVLADWLDSLGDIRLRILTTELPVGMATELGGLLTSDGTGWTVSHDVGQSWDGDGVQLFATLVAVGLASRPNQVAATGEVLLHGTLTIGGTTRPIRVGADDAVGHR
jgi:hypothetical protein